jgi:hypothetical protein
MRMHESRCMKAWAWLTMPVSQCMNQATPILWALATRLQEHTGFPVYEALILNFSF